MYLFIYFNITKHVSFRKNRGTFLAQHCEIANTSLNSATSSHKYLLVPISYPVPVPVPVPSLFIITLKEDFF
jgi:hypothetical protein